MGKGKGMPTQGMIFPEAMIAPFKRCITDRCGLYFKDYELRVLKDAVTERMAVSGHSTIEEYYTYLTASKKSEEEFKELLNLLTVRHTYFFRNRPHFNALRDRVIPEITSRRTGKGGMKGNVNPTLRIWSAGCATGEEPYSIAMAVQDVIEKLRGWKIEIIATDVSTKALKVAKRGRYNKNSVRLVDPDQLLRYFVKVPKQTDCYVVSETIREMVHFGYLNIWEDPFPEGFDIVYCRNVLIYFKLDTILEIIDRMHSSLVDDGFLFVGHSESLQFLTDQFEMECCSDAIFYRKRTREAIRGPRQLGTVGTNRPVEELLDELSKEELRADRRFSGRGRTGTKLTLDEQILRIIKCIHMKEYDEAFQLIEKAREIDKDAADLHYLSAEIHTNRGEYGEAREKLAKALEIDPFYAPAHYLLGSIALDESDTAEAKRKLKKALYIDGNFSMARFLLGIVYKNEGQTERAIREFGNVLRDLKGRSADEIVPYSGGFSTVSLAGVCTENIERLGTSR